VSIVDLATFAGDTISARCFQPKVILEGPKGTDDLPSQEACSFDVMSC
jgi:hypothetical protein